MPLTVADVLALPVLAAGGPRVRAGGTGLAAQVRWVHVSEQTEVAGTLGGGELLLSTGMGLLEPGFDAGRYLASLAGAGAVGLVVELGQHVRALPEALVHAAAAARFPLVELSKVVRFVAVTEQVHARILHEQYERLRFSELVHETFASMSVGGARVAEVLEQASALTGRVVVLEDLGHHAVAFAGGGPAQEVLLDWTARSRLVPVAAGTAVGGPQRWLTTPVGVVGQRWGRLVLPEDVALQDSTSAGPGGAGGPGDAPQVELVLERAAETLTIARLLDREAPEHRGDIAQEAHESLLRDLRRGRRADEAELRARARALGLPLRGGFAPVVAHVPGEGTAGGPEGDAATADAAERALAETRTAGLVGVLEPGLVGVLVSAPVPELAGDVLPRLARALLEVERRLGLPAATLGTAPPGTTLTAAGEGFAEAGHVAVVAASLPHHDPAVPYRAGDLGARGLLWWLRDDPRLQGFVEAHLAPLLAGPDGEEALALLRAHLECSGSMTRLAARLHLSRPATYGRVERLRARLGRDLDDPETRLTLHLAVLAHGQARP
ncbi:PucR family transcriptional regulator [Kineococcus rubinsiae]|uniref:PucR family transcriptional regulator n=1 Tax=Kineococcus rubinsiae TaxID=2609562 RepID=UPI001430919D|nr:PucR family transcriptional regulator [Kineococcus rubinsiae]NIZ90644.1 PucR family transcriptional regulator [Kineococcus rubinsiae]